MPIARERILYEDEQLLAVAKLGGELVVRGKGKLEKLPLLDYLRKEYISLVPLHRLDFETSGVVVFGKTRAVLAHVIETKFLGWEKTYQALVVGVPPRREGVIDFRLPARSGMGVVQAQTHYKVIQPMRGCALVECRIERGQRHQIRRHLSMIGHPLVLDQIYGDAKANKRFGKFLKMSRFLLHHR
jgi:23S rRNA-/tRNA-specific pseudouridylate synthase